MEEINWLELLEWNEDQLEELRFLGFAYLKQGKYDIARSFFESLVAVNPQSFYDVQTLGAIYLQEGHAAKALFYLDQALKIDPKHTYTLMNRCKSLLIVGKLKEGLSIAKKLKKDQDSDISNVASALVLAYTPK